MQLLINIFFIVPPTNDIFSELAGLTTHSPVASPTYSGGILQPYSPKPSITPSMIPQIQPQQQKPTVYKEDPYAALRDLSIGSKPAAAPTMNTLKIKTSDDTMSWGGMHKKIGG